jgi:hypothetical protein
MRVRFKRPDPTTVPRNEEFYVAPEQLFFTEGESYVVHAVSVYDGVTFLQVVDDLQTPLFRPRTLFEADDLTIPSDWIVNVFQQGPIQLLMGPPYVAKDLESYNAMIDQRAPQMKQFWKRVDSAKPSSDDDDPQ